MYSVHHHSKQRLLDPFSTSIFGTRLHDCMHSSAVKNASSDHVCGIRWTFGTSGNPNFAAHVGKVFLYKTYVLHMLVGGFFITVTPRTQKKMHSQHFWSLVFRIVFPHRVLLSKLCSWPSGSLKGHVRCTQYSAMSWTTSLEGKLRYHTIMIIHICKIFNFGLAVFMTSGCLSMIWEIPLQTHAQNMFIDGHIRQEWTRLQPVGRCRHLGDYGIREVPLISVSKDILKYRFRTNQSLVHGVNPL